MNDIDAFIDALDAYFKKQYPNIPHGERLLSRSVKLSEEVGELSEAVLGLCGHQRSDKEGSDFPKEVADVIITTLLLAKSENIDVWGEVRKKLAVVKERYSLPD